MEIAFPAMETRRNNLVFTFWMKWLRYSQLSIFATAKWFLNTRLVFWKNLTQSWCPMQQSYPNQLCSLLFPPSSEQGWILGVQVTKKQSPWVPLF